MATMIERNMFNNEVSVAASAYSTLRASRLAIIAFLVVSTLVVFSLPASAGPITFRGCFASGPKLDGTADPAWDMDVDTITGALIGTGSWQAGNTTKLKNGSRTAIETCIGNAKTASIPGNEFVFFFSGHGGDSFFPDAAEAGEGGGSDNHIRIGNTAGGAADRITDDQLAGLLSGFKKSVTISVILDSCYSHTFFDGANDLGSVTQVNGVPTPAGDHLALAAASSATTPTCAGGFTTRFANGISTFNADTDRDGVITTQEATDFVTGFFATGTPKCEGVSCPSPPVQQPDYVGPIDCDPRSDVCPTVAAVPEPASLLLVVSGITVLGAGAWRRNWTKRKVGANRFQ